MPTPTPSLSTPLELSFNKTVQRDITIYSFTLSAEQLLQVAKIDRFGESSDGVNRKFDQNHAIRIAQAMVEPDTVMLDAICGDMKGNWTIDEKTGLLTIHPNAYLSIDDGQHRYGACDLLNPEERSRWSFTIQATRGVDFATRLKIFRQQKKRKPIDSRLDLAQRSRLDDWRTPAEREAYNLVMRLNTDTTSPLKGMIILEETVKRSYEHKHRVEGINAAGLWRSFKSSMSKGSPLFSLSIEKRVEVMVNVILVASEVWPKAWKSKDSILTTARGINAVVKLIVSGNNFRIVVGNDFTVESLRNALVLARKFNWTAKANKGKSVDEITSQLDATIGRGHQRQLESGERQVVA